MKMEYQKPMVAVEHYKLSQSIAACSIKINSLDHACVVKDVDSPPEMRSIAYLYPEYFSVDCTTNAAYIQNNDSICYHTQVSAAFTS